ncbi:hypothetical protein PYWP30_02171 [Pyrobaculum sp. WP30]|nr:hypothetical protein PYWP30_02171 [Pyrobaculum sp. WP30]
MRRFALVLAAATAALALYLLNIASHATAQLFSAPATAAPPLRHYNDTAERRREAQVAATPAAAINITEVPNSTNILRKAWPVSLSNVTAVEYCPVQTTTCTTSILTSASNASAVLTKSAPPAQAGELGEEVQTAAAGGAALPAIHLAFGAAGVAFYGYGLYLSACGGPVCRWRRFRAIAPLSAATVLASVALSAASPLFLALSAPGVWGLIHYYRAKRRLALWLSSTLT